MRLAEPATDLGPEVAELLDGIDHQATAAAAALTQHPPGPARESPPQLVAEHHELCRQLAALRERAAGAESRNRDVWALRSELATLSSFAATLRADAEAWRALRDEVLAELERQRTAARQRRERWLAEHQELVRRREALQSRIDETARGLARSNGGDCRRTVPVVTLGETLTICSVTVLTPRRWFRSWKLWLVTLDESWDEVLVRRQ